MLNWKLTLPPSVFKGLFEHSKKDYLKFSESPEDFKFKSGLDRISNVKRVSIGNFV